MPAKKIRIKKKKDVALSPRSIERVQSKQRNDTSDASKTLRVEDPDDEEVIDNSASTVVELNSASLKDPVKQRPLRPEEVEHSPDIDLTLDLSEPTFKFYCYRCGQKLKVPLTWANMSTPCGRCGHDLVVPPPIAGVDL